MTKKNRLLLVITAIFVMITMIAVVCYVAGAFDKKFDKNDPATWYEANRKDGVKDALTEQIKVGMTLSEVVDIIGKPQRDIGSGAWLMEWELQSGDKLVVAFNSSSIESISEGADSSKIEYNLIAYHIEITEN